MAQVLMPNVGQKDDALTTLVKGLSIASQVYGIRANMAQLDEYQRKQEKEENLSAGKYDKNQQVELAQKFDISQTAPTEGRYVQATDLASNSPIYLSLKKDTSPILRDIKGVQNGQSGTFVKDYRTGKTVDFIADAGSKPERVEYVDKNGNKQIAWIDPRAGTNITSYAERTPVKIDTVDDKGNPITAFVTPKAGETYASAPRADQKASKEQFDAATYGRRMESADQVLNDLIAQGYNRSSNAEGIKAFILPNAMKSSQLKQQEQAERNFINAALRRESGAAISESEFANAREQYFPRAGDTAEVLAQKAQNRQQVIAGMQAAAGIAWDKVPAIPIATVKKDTSGTAFAAPAAPAAPKVGTEDGGYIYQGGDPANPKSWKKK